MKLILMRHAKAEPFTDDAGDFARRLVPAGRRRAQATAQALGRLGARPDLALVSPSARTMETWEAAQPVLGGEMRPLQALYHAAPGAVMDAVVEAAKPDIVLMVVGHNPGMHQLTLNLAQAGNAPAAAIDRLGEGFPTASAAVFDWPDVADKPAFRAMVIKDRTFVRD